MSCARSSCHSSDTLIDSTALARRPVTRTPRGSSLEPWVVQKLDRCSSCSGVMHLAAAASFRSFRTASLPPSAVQVGDGEIDAERSSPS